VTRHGAQFRVVGGSALSPPELWNGKGKPFARGYPVVLDEARAGLSDVGFRLAFTAPQESVAARIRRFVRRQGYLAQQLQQGRP